MSAPEWDFDPQVSTAGFFGDTSDDEDASRTKEDHIRVHHFRGMDLRIRETEFHPVNANFVWPGSVHLAQWILDESERKQYGLKSQRILELGSATGALAIYLRAQGYDVLTSDYEDMEVEENIAFNFKLNGSDPPAHLRHTWGERLDEVDSFLDQHGPFDAIIASDILLYTKHYSALLATLEHIMGPHDDSTGPGSDTEPVPEGKGGTGRPSVLLMSWKRRILEGDGENFFAMAERSGKFRVKEVGSKILKSLEYRG